MMIDVTVADRDLDLTSLYTGMNPLVAGASLLRQSSSGVVFQTEAGDRFVITGTDLHWGLGGLTGGAVDALTLRSHGVALISFATLQISADRLWGAFVAEQDGSDPAALTHMLVHHCWTYHGSAGVDYFPKTNLLPFGLLDPTGNDKVFLNDGNDVFFTGAAKDTVLGGAGDDQIAGGSDNDRLSGDTGNDRLNGGTGDDRLLGGTGDDVISGSNGADTLAGGFGADQLNGGAGADVFVFSSHSGYDTVHGYTPGEDHLDITSTVPLSMIDLGADCLVQFGQQAVLLEGINAAQLTDGDFL